MDTTAKGSDFESKSLLIRPLHEIDSCTFVTKFVGFDGGAIGGAEA
jgi:hypothetical protein